MIDTIQDLLEQKTLYHKLLKRVESLEALLNEQNQKASSSSKTKDSKKEETTTSKADFTKIKGIGKVIAGKLVAHGFHSFSQLASLTEEEITALEEKLGIFSGKIKREAWVEQAKGMEG